MKTSAHCWGRSTFLSIILLTVYTWTQAAQAPLLVAPRFDSNGWAHVAGQAPTGSVVTILGSTNLTQWSPVAVLHADAFDYLDPAATNRAFRFYHFQANAAGVTNDWKNQVEFPLDDFVNYFGGATERWIKFAVLTNEPTRVYYGTAGFAFHYDFAKARLAPFREATPSQFEQWTSFNQGRRAFLGTLLFPLFNTKEYGIQLVSQDPLPREQVRDLFYLVKSTVVDRSGALAFYIPTYEQLKAAEADREWFLAQGIPVSTSERWAQGDVCYSGGWALGELKFVPATNIVSAYANGTLQPSDILVTDGIPAELPYVAGIISLAPGTANSHAAILARSYAVPFIYVVDDAERAKVMQMVNREVILQAELSEFQGCRSMIVELAPNLDPAVRADILDMQQSPLLTVVPKATLGAYTASTDNLTPADIRFFGGKAANYGLLRRTIPSNTPVAIAISFDLWDEFMSQTLSNGLTLRAEISNRLAGFTYPPNVGALQVELNAIRNLIRQATQFTPGQEQAIRSALGIFDGQRNIRFRSSTNVEDSDSFSGAGLYDSYSGCLADDLDSDTAGPSLCDPTETGERGVFRAIRRVYASFYNDNAYLERLRRGVDENTVGMAMLVHHSTPDPFEMANGVATVTYAAAPVMEGVYATQAGAVSVANPDGTALPEEVSTWKFAPGTLSYLTLRQHSSLLPRGDSVLDWPLEYDDLDDLVYTVLEAYAAQFTNKPTFTLDLEYKKVTPGHLEIKQVREIPAQPSSQVAPYLLNQPTEMVSWQGYYANLWGVHRLKSRWRLETRTMPLHPVTLQEGLYTHLAIEHLDGTNRVVNQGSLESLPGGQHTFQGLWSLDRWRMGTGAGQADITLETVLDLYPVDYRWPFVTMERYARNIAATYTKPVPRIDNIISIGQLFYETNELVSLRPALQDSHQDSLHRFVFTIPGQGTNVLVDTAYRLGSTEVYGDRPPLVRFVQTRITGLTTEPLVLTNYWSQSFSVTHRPGSENFIFEPRLEPSVSPAQLAELEAKDIVYLYLHRNAAYVDEQLVERPILKVIAFDGTLRTWSDQDFED